MGETTAITWTDHTFNPWIGCQRVSPGCNNCYAEALNKRWGGTNWGANAPRRTTSAANWRHPLKWNRDAELAGRPALVFCASMADVFEDRDDLHEPRWRLFDLILDTPHLTWQLLTKRPENVVRLVPSSWLGGHFALGTWPANVWIGTTVEDQRRANERIPRLLEIPAPVRFLSCEPLLDDIELREWMHPSGKWMAGVPEAELMGCNEPGREPLRAEVARRNGWRTVEWIIAGGESGPGHRPLDLEHARSIRDQAARATVPFFFKQHGGRTPTAGGHLLDGHEHHAFPPEARR